MIRYFGIQVTKLASRTTAKMAAARREVESVVAGSETMERVSRGMSFWAEGSDEWIGRRRRRRMNGIVEARTLMLMDTIVVVGRTA